MITSGHETTRSSSIYIRDVHTPSPPRLNFHSTLCTSHVSAAAPLPLQLPLPLPLPFEWVSQAKIPYSGQSIHGYLGKITKNTRSWYAHLTLKRRLLRSASCEQLCCKLTQLRNCAERILPEIAEGEKYAKDWKHSREFFRKLMPREEGIWWYLYITTSFLLILLITLFLPFFFSVSVNHFQLARVPTANFSCNHWTFTQVLSHRLCREYTAIGARKLRLNVR